jgi:hypothetical protein
MKTKKVNKKDLMNLVIFRHVAFGVSLKEYRTGNHRDKTYVLMFDNHSGGFVLLPAKEAVALAPRLLGDWDGNAGFCVNTARLTPEDAAEVTALWGDSTSNVQDPKMAAVLKQITFTSRRYKSPANGYPQHYSLV